MKEISGLALTGCIVTMEAPSRVLKAKAGRSNIFCRRFEKFPQWHHAMHSGKPFGKLKADIYFSALVEMPGMELLN